ncbi:ATP-binding cassette domain-containing protein [Sneathiella sp. P13V-1]|uniref:ATP-binding cassette domain-containing protein n=1 Tax=Sneathiella sp. P13V-1 TaxID=2697366 RepID=UPI00187B631E|nr:ATP-binding cassette domain-containing protein [Sneathiella sp. P13V-1]MBE7637105.1 ATP-binding cassette domain-containing protein [Sneathiella sp. P13V-1]
MAAPVLALQDARITFGGGDLFRDISLGIELGMRIALVGRNGSGKSTLLKAIAGDIELDGGERFLQAGTRVGYLRQQPEIVPGRTVHEQVSTGLPPELKQDGMDSGYLVDRVLEGVGIEGDRLLETLSGGEARRVSLAEALVSDPDVLLLDEPTNHLDIKTILWLEQELKSFKGALLIISHDRQFLKNLTNSLFWLDRGKLRTHGKGFAAFEEWSEEILRAEEVELKKMDKRIADETDWSRKGITARRARNEGRLRALNKLRAERKERTSRVGNAKLEVKSGDKSGRVVVEATEITKSFETASGEQLQIIKKFSTRIMRGDRVGIIGPNGAGKSTLLKMLIGELAPDSGTIKLGTNLTPAVFDQKRESLNPEESLWDTLADPGSGQLLVKGEVRHVVAYLRDFLFEDKQAKSPVKSLSGGEKNRLLLAKLLARESNLLVLDEPTNDLDMETLDLLEDMLSGYDGTLILISHDRDFLDQLVTSVIAIEEGGEVNEYVGGYTDYLRQRKEAEKPAPKKQSSAPKATPEKPKSQRNKLTYKDQRDLDRLPEVMEKLEAKIQELEIALADPDLFTKSPDKFQTLSTDHAAAQQELSDAEERWLELEIMQEELNS